jgi:hypothetical protein
VNLPDWLVDEVLAGAKPAAFRLAVVLHRHGSARVDARGARVLYWRGSLQSLGRLAGLSKPALIEAELWLDEMGALRRHGRVEARAPHAVSVAVDLPFAVGGKKGGSDFGDGGGGKNFLPASEPESARSGKNFLPACEAKSATHGGGGDLDPLPGVDGYLISTTTNTPGAVRILDRLAALGVSDPEGLVAEFGAGRCEAAAAVAEGQMGLSNPAGFAVSLLRSRRRLRVPLAAQGGGGAVERGDAERVRAYRREHGGSVGAASVALGLGRRVAGE